MTLNPDKTILIMWNSSFQFCFAFFSLLTGVLVGVPQNNNTGFQSMYAYIAIF